MSCPASYFLSIRKVLSRSEIANQGPLRLVGSVFPNCATATVTPDKELKTHHRLRP
jgi:hypothetical protein